MGQNLNVEPYILANFMLGEIITLVNTYLEFGV